MESSINGSKENNKENESSKPNPLTEKIKNQIQIYLKIELDILIQNYVIYILLMN